MKVGNRGRREGLSDTTQRNFIGQIGTNDLLVKVSQSFVLLCGFLNVLRVVAKTEALQRPCVTQEPGLGGADVQTQTWQD